MKTVTNILIIISLVISIMAILNASVKRNAENLKIKKEILKMEIQILKIKSEILKSINEKCDEEK